MTRKSERRKNKRYVIIENVSEVLRDLKKGEVIVDLSLKGARLVSLEPQKVGKTLSFSIPLPYDMGTIDLRGRIVRNKMRKTEKALLYETGVEFAGLNPADATILGKYISFLERDKVLREGRQKIKELLEATKKLKKSILILKCSLNPPKGKDTTN